MTSGSQDTEFFDSSNVPRTRLAPGAVLSRRYHLDRELGRGGMGVVYRATDLELRREVAVKVLPEAVCLPMLSAAGRWPFSMYLYGKHFAFPPRLARLVVVKPIAST